MEDHVWRTWEDLEGAVVTGWRGVEWALTGGHGGAPAVFARPDVPFGQYWSLDLDLAGHPSRAVRTYQADTDWGLYVTTPGPPPRSTVTRTVTPSLPTGELEILDVASSAGVVAEVLLAVAGHRVLLVAGEAEEGPDGELTFVRRDESVLVFDDPTAADRLDWRPPRPPGSGAR